MFDSRRFERFVVKALKRSQKFQLTEVVATQPNSMINRLRIIVLEGLKHTDVEGLSQMSGEGKVPKKVSLKLRSLCAG